MQRFLKRLIKGVITARNAFSRYVILNISNVARWWIGRGTCKQFQKLIFLRYAAFLFHSSRVPCVQLCPIFIESRVNGGFFINLELIFLQWNFWTLIVFKLRAIGNKMDLAKSFRKMQISKTLFFVEFQEWNFKVLLHWYLNWRTN